MIVTMLERIRATRGIDGRDQMGNVVRTGLAAIMNMDIPTTPEGAKLRYSLAIMDRRLEEQTKAFDRTAKGMGDSAAVKALDKDGNPVMAPDERGAVSPQWIVMREKRIEMENSLQALLDEECQIDRAKIVWPEMYAAGDKERKYKVLPKPSDMALTMDFIDYSGVCGE